MTSRKTASIRLAENRVLETIKRFGLVLFLLTLSVEGRVPIADFETPDQISAWGLNTGSEFPGGRGNLGVIEIDSNILAELRYDFTPPTSTSRTFDPRYVAATRDISMFPASANAKQIRVRFEVSNSGVVPRVRIIDSSGQTLQYTLPTRKSLGGIQYGTVEVNSPQVFWGGANDGKPRFPLKTLWIVADATGQRNSGWLRFDNPEIVASNAVDEVDPWAGVSKNSFGVSRGLSSIAGISIHRLNDPGLMDLIAQYGFKFVRIDFKWASVEKSRGVYDFSAYANFVNLAEARGLSTIAILDYGNDLHTGGENLPPRTESALDAWTRYCAAAAENFRGRKVIFEVWNEPDVGIFWGGSPNSAEYGIVLQKAIAGIRSVDTSAKITNAGLSSPSTNNFAYWNRLYDADQLRGIDQFSTHLYTDQSPELRISDIAKLRELVTARSGSIPLICTEWGYSSTDLSPERDGTNAIARQKQAVLATRLMLTGWLTNLDLITLYGIRDDGSDKANKEHNFGLLDSSGNVKPSGTAIQWLLSFVKGFAFEGVRVADDIADDVYFACFKGTETRRYILWSDSTASPLRLNLAKGVYKVWDAQGRARSPNRSTETTVSFDIAPGSDLLYFEGPLSIAETAISPHSVIVEVTIRP